MKKNKILGILVALILLLGVGSYTYALYQNNWSGHGNVKVAKWAVDLTDGSESLSENFELIFKVNDNEDVAEGYIAPGTSATTQLVIDPTGTQVSVDYSIELDSANLQGLPFEISSVKAGDTSLTATDGKYTGTISYSENMSPITLTITVNWPNGEASVDTPIGKTASEYTLPITLTASQHISE